MERYSIDKIRAKGIEVRDNDNDKILSVGDEVYFNKALPEQPSELFEVTVSKENLQVLWYLLYWGIKECKDICHYDMPWISNNDYFAYKVDSKGTLSSVKFLGKCEQFVKPLSVKYSADNLLLIPWSPEIDKDAERAPYVSVFKGKLAYVAAKHEKGINSHTFQLIKKTIDEFQPNIIILEGREDYCGISPLPYPGKYKKCKPDFSECGEPTYTQWLAYEKGIPVIFGEPVDEDIKNEFLTKGYTIQDLLGYYFLRRHNSRELSGKKEFDDDMKWFRSEERFDVQPELVFRYEDFLKWYSEKTGEAFSHKNGTDPLDGNSGNFLLKLAQEVSNYRDANITRTIAYYLNRYDRVMVVCGCGHFATQRKVLEKMFSGE